MTSVITANMIGNLQSFVMRAVTKKLTKETKHLTPRPIQSYQYSPLLVHSAITKPAASKKIDSWLHLLPPSAQCQRWTSHQWRSWARWSAVAREILAPVWTQRDLVRVFLTSHMLIVAQTVKNVVDLRQRKANVVQLWGGHQHFWHSRVIAYWGPGAAKLEKQTPCFY